MQEPNWTPTARSIRRNHPFFQDGGTWFGWDWQTFRVCYPRSAAILWAELYGEGQP